MLNNLTGKFVFKKTMPDRYQMMCALLINAGNRVSGLVCPEDGVNFVTIMKRILHADDRLNGAYVRE
jgi:hypothetical protein